jgi:hypothetical protein
VVRSVDEMALALPIPRDDQQGRHAGFGEGPQKRQNNFDAHKLRARGEHVVGDQLAGPEVVAESARRRGCSAAARRQRGPGMWSGHRRAKSGGTKPDRLLSQSPKQCQIRGDWSRSSRAAPLRRLRTRRTKAGSGEDRFAVGILPVTTPIHTAPPGVCPDACLYPADVLDIRYS